MHLKHTKKNIKGRTHLICSLIAASQSSEYFWRARESWGTVGTSVNSLFNSSKGSKTTPVKGLWLVAFEAQTMKPFPLLAEKLSRQKRFSPWVGVFNKEKAGATLRSMVQIRVT